MRCSKCFARNVVASVGIIPLTSFSHYKESPTIHVAYPFLHECMPASIRYCLLDANDRLTHSFFVDISGHHASSAVTTTKVSYNTLSCRPFSSTHTRNYMFSHREERIRVAAMKKEIKAEVLAERASEARLHGHFIRAAILDTRSMAAHARASVKMTRADIVHGIHGGDHSTAVCQVRSDQ